ncbi:MAG: class I SAM-dependent methyltransferase [Candidatus Omnitrophica bacterium]|nr:class I SAM-dependent methyltransferase [Candidatus Omnitrophota bacterium]
MSKNCPCTDNNMNLDEYYKNPVIDSWTYVAMGMDKLKEHDRGSYDRIKESQELLFSEQEEIMAYVKENSARLGWDWPEVSRHIEQFLQKFPLALRRNVAWDDFSFIFLYLLTKIIRPRVIIETGSNIGFSSSFIALAVKENNNNCKFYTIDPYLEYEWKAMSFYEHSQARKQKINYSKVIGRCAPLAIVPADLKEHIILKSGYSRDVLPGLLKENEIVDIFFHDSDHGYRNMVWECASALPQVSPGGYVLVHDINLNVAFKKMFGDAGGVEIKEHLGVFRKNDEKLTIDGQWSYPESNSSLNDLEYKNQKTELESSPKNMVIQLGGVCDLNCVFCSGRKNKEGLTYDEFYRNLEGKITRYLAQAEKIIFKSCGNFFKAAEMQRMLNWHINCIELNFPLIEKVYYTNGFDLTEQAIDFIIHPGGICGREYPVKSTVNILLYASNSKMYKTLTRSEDFNVILKRVQQLIRTREDKNRFKIVFTFFATTLNIEDLPEFVRLASSLGADKVDCLYSYIYVPGQKYLSCFFKQKMTNEILEKTDNLATRLGLEVALPPKFGQKSYPNGSVCCKPWDQITINAAGDVLACDSGITCDENLQKKPFMEAWNSPYYQNLRKEVARGSGCFNYCFSANPACVNDFRAHVFCQESKKPEINILWADNF